MVGVMLRSSNGVPCCASATIGAAKAARAASAARFILRVMCRLGLQEEMMQERQVACRPSYRACLPTGQRCLGRYFLIASIGAAIGACLRAVATRSFPRLRKAPA